MLIKQSTADIKTISGRLGTQRLRAPPPRNLRIRGTSTQESPWVFGGLLFLVLFRNAVGQRVFICPSRLCANLAKSVTKAEAAGQPVNLVQPPAEVTIWPAGLVSLRWRTVGVQKHRTVQLNSSMAEGFSSPALEESSKPHENHGAIAHRSMSTACWEQNFKRTKPGDTENLSSYL